MTNDKTPVERARWLAELAQALDDARGVLLRLGATPTHDVRMIELYMRIEAARIEVESLRLSRSVREKPLIDPKWSQSPPWEPGPRARG